MAYKNRLLEKLNLPTRIRSEHGPRAGDITEMMMDPRYLRQSSTLVNEALQKGFDVLQLEDGEIVMTGTRTIVYRYYWDAEKGKLMKAETQITPEEETLASFEAEEA